MGAGDQETIGEPLTSEDRTLGGDVEEEEVPTAPARPPSLLNLLHGTQVSIEKTRIAAGNRVNAIVRGADYAPTPVTELYEELWHDLERWETRIEKAMAGEAANFKVWDTWLSHVRGIGPGLASQMLAMLLPPLAERGPSTWYKAGGLNTELQPDGLMRLPRARAGQDGLSYYPRLRRCLWNVATSFVRVGGYYRAVYERQKARLQAIHVRDPHWPPHRIDAAARWAMIKLFLAHLWCAWLEAEGIQEEAQRKAYVIDVLRHPTYIPLPRWDGKAKI